MLEGLTEIHLIGLIGWPGLLVPGVLGGEMSRNQDGDHARGVRVAACTVVCPFVPMEIWMLGWRLETGRKGCHDTQPLSSW